MYKTCHNIYRFMTHVKRLLRYNIYTLFLSSWNSVMVIMITFPHTQRGVIYVAYNPLCHFMLLFLCYLEQNILFHFKPREFF